MRFEGGFEEGWADCLSRSGPNLWLHVFEGWYCDNNGRPIEPTEDDFFDRLPEDPSRQAAYEEWRMTPPNSRPSWEEWDNAWQLRHPKYRDRKTGQLYAELHEDGAEKVVPVPA